MKGKNHLKVISILAVVIVIASSTLVVLSQPVTVNKPFPEEGKLSVTENKTFGYYGMMFAFRSLNYTHISGIVKSNSTSYLAVLMTPEQMFGWLNESNRSIWGNKAIQGVFNGTVPVGILTITTNLTPVSYINNQKGSGNLPLSWNLIPGKSYILLFVTARETNEVLSIDTDLGLSYTYSII